jgi:hypothetical protein
MSGECPNFVNNWNRTCSSEDIPDLGGLSDGTTSLFFSRRLPTEGKVLPSSIVGEIKVKTLTTVAYSQIWLQ